MGLYILAMAPPLKRGHLISLLRSIQGSPFCAQYENEFKHAQDVLMHEADMSTSAFDVFTDGPLAGRYVKTYPLQDRSFHLAPKLLITDDEETLNLLTQMENPLIERIFTSFVIDAEIIYEVEHALREAGGNPMVGRTFLEIYQATVGVAYLDDVISSVG